MVGEAIDKVVSASVAKFLPNETLKKSIVRAKFFNPPLELGVIAEQSVANSGQLQAMMAQSNQIAWTHRTVQAVEHQCTENCRKNKAEPLTA